MLHRRPWIITLIGSAVLAWTATAAVAQRRADQSDSYLLKRIIPKGFGIFKGVLDWVPISPTKAIAFAPDQLRGSYEYRLSSFTLSDAGVASSSNTIASGLGRPRAVACVWDGNTTSELPDGTGHGLVFALFIKEYLDSDPYHEDIFVYVGNFNASGRLVGSWRELLRFETHDFAYFPDEALFAARYGDSVGVVPSFYVQGAGGVQTGAYVYFIEVDLEDGSTIGQPVPLPLPQSGRLINALGYEPVWNGTNWLVPVGATQFKSPGTFSDISMNKALISSVTGDASHTAASYVVAKDATTEYRPYDDLCLTPYPGSSTDFLLFLKQTLPFPEDERAQDYSAYKFTLKRLDQRGKPVKSLAVTVPALTHVIPADPAYEPSWAYDHWSRIVARGDTLYISRAHDMTLWKSGDPDAASEQQCALYTLDPVTGQVVLDSRSYLRRATGYVLPPIVREFSSSRFGVVNSLWLYQEPYPRISYFSLFER